MNTLRKARDEGRLEEFIAEREGEAGDAEAFNRGVASMARRSSEARPASKKGNRDG
jgi:hypothetical protein